jgi:DNA topoisomerase I
MARLRRVDCSGPGIERRRRGRGFEYVDERGRRVGKRALERISELAIPPAWEEVWICPDAMGHIQATGIDARGRKQYRYHDRWHEQQGRRKFDEMLDFAKALPKLRKRVDRDLRGRNPTRERVQAGAARLLDRGFFRIGTEGYAEENETYGVATLRKRHVEVRGDRLDFDYTAKGGIRRRQEIEDPQLAKLIRTLLRRRGGGHELLAYKRGNRWRDLRSEDINEYVREHTQGGFSAKDFRTWNATVLAAMALAAGAAEHPTETKAQRKRVERIAVKEVARMLGNTPAVCRSSYIDPRVFDRFDGGQTIKGALQRLPENPADWPELQGGIERATLRLLTR